MRSDPKPSDLVAVDDANGPIVHADTGREDRPSGVDTLEMEARVIWVLLEERICPPRLPPDLLR